MIASVTAVGPSTTPVAESVTSCTAVVADSPRGPRSAGSPGISNPTASFTPMSAFLSSSYLSCSVVVGQLALGMGAFRIYGHPGAQQRETAAVLRLGRLPPGLVDHRAALGTADERVSFWMRLGIRLLTLG